MCSTKATKNNMSQSISNIITDSVRPFVDGESFLLLSIKENGVEKQRLKVYPKEILEVYGMDSDSEEMFLCKHCRNLVQFRTYNNHTRSWGELSPVADTNLLSFLVPLAQVMVYLEPSHTKLNISKTDPLADLNCIIDSLFLKGPNFIVTSHAKRVIGEKRKREEESRE
jgi:hypothetical protein